MKTVYFSFCFLLFLFVSKAQNKCPEFIQDTLLVPKEGKTVTGGYLQANLKNGAILRLYKTTHGKYYLKLFVTENLYFDKVDLLEIQSGSKSFYAKDTKQFEAGKAVGYFVVEIFINYISTLKHEGMTAILFGKVETSFTRQDANQVKRIAECLYNSIETKK